MRQVYVALGLDKLDELREGVTVFEGEDDDD